MRGAGKIQYREKQNCETDNLFSKIMPGDYFENAIDEIDLQFEV